MVRFGHTSDWHLGKEKHERYDDHFIAINHIITQAIEEDIAFLLISGDIFDRPNPHPRTLYLAHHYLQLLQKAQIPVYVIRGNHDVSQRFIGENTLNFFEKLGLFKVIEDDVVSVEIEKKVVSIYGIGYVYEHTGTVHDVIDNLLAKHPINQDHTNILMLHASVSGLTTNNDQTSDGRPSRSDEERMSSSSTLLANYGFSYVALGHHHRSAYMNIKKCVVAYSGAPDHWNIRNWDGIGTPTLTKSWLLVEYSNRKIYPSITEKSFPVRPKFYYRQDFRELPKEETIDEITKQIKSLNQLIAGGILRGRVLLPFNRLEEQNPFIEWKNWIPDLLPRFSNIEFIDLEIAMEMENAEELSDYDIMDEYIKTAHPKQADLWINVIKQGLGMIAELDILKYNLRDDKIGELKEYLKEKLTEVPTDA